MCSSLRVTAADRLFALTDSCAQQIRCPRGAAAEMIATKLDRKLRDHILNSKDNLFSPQARPNPSIGGTPTSRPVLIILDRNVDLIPMLSHSWTYQSLCFDIFKVSAPFAGDRGTASLSSAAVGTEPDHHRDSDRFKQPCKRNDEEDVRPCSQRLLLGQKCLPTVSSGCRGYWSVALRLV